MTYNGTTQHWMTYDGMTQDRMMPHDGMTHWMMHRSSGNRRYRHQQKYCNQDDTHLSPSVMPLG